MAVHSFLAEDLDCFDWLAVEEEGVVVENACADMLMLMIGSVVVSVVIGSSVAW